MSSPSAKDFYRLYEVPIVVVSMIYILVLTIASISILVRRFCKQKFEHKCCSFVLDEITSFNAWVIRLIFGKSQGISEGDAGKKGETAEPQDIKDIYVGDVKMDHLEINIIGSILLCLAIIMGIVAYLAYLLEITYTCTENPAIYCYPIYIDEDNPENPDITELDRMSPITNCSEWLNATTAQSVTFQCFKYAYDSKAAVSTAGGLLALFTLATRIIVTIIRKVFEVTAKCFSPRCQDILHIIAYAISFAITVTLILIITLAQLNDRFDFTGSQRPRGQRG